VGLVNAAMGFDVTATFSVHYQDSVNVAAYSCVRIDSWQAYKVYKFDVWNDNHGKVDSGWAANEDGYVFAAYSC
jgi:hypothetical protein